MKRYYNNYYNREIVTFSRAVNQTDEMFTTISVLLYLTTLLKNHG